MRYVLIFNPVAGKKNPFETYFPSLDAYFKEHNMEFTYYLTEHRGHATEIARLEAEKGDDVRIFGFGGDGTLREIALGAAGHEKAEVGIFPCGSGNDYVRTFGDGLDFNDVERQLFGESKTVDMIRADDTTALGLCSIGLDASVALNMVKFKSWPLVSGSMAYNLALVKCLCSRIGSEMEVLIDEGKRIAGNFLFVLAGSGQYYGGGYRGAPEAVPDDGLLDFVLVRKVSRFRLATLLKLYKAGQHLHSPKFKDLLYFERGRRMEVRPRQPITANYDGECRRVNSISFEVLPQAVRFILPATHARQEMKALI